MIRIAVTGPESSGKTSLCQALANHYKIAFIPEYARTYLEHTNGVYNQKDLDKIAQGQFESVITASGEIIISDTDFVVMEIWSIYKYQNASEYITELVKKDLFDLHILCAPDIPWEPDPLREKPNDREELFERYKSALEGYQKEFIIVQGNPKNRLIKSLEKIGQIQNK
ncbi:MAG: AAA family ATPase [Crocinitomicaceae bacterium]